MPWPAPVFLFTLLAWSALEATCLAAPPELAAQLPGTAALELTAPLDEVMVAGIDRFALRGIADSVVVRQQYWHRDFSSIPAYERSVAGNRERLRQLLGAVDPRVPRPVIEDLSQSRLYGGDAAGTRLINPDDPLETYSIVPTRWPVLPGVHGEGLLLIPDSTDIAGVVIAIPDADWTPEAFCGADSTLPEASPLPRWLVSQGYLVVIPTLISREDTFSGNAEIALTNQTHREWVYRSAYEMGRHVIGYEVQKILAAVDGIRVISEESQRDLPIAVAGIGEGGLLALYAAALDSRIEAVLVSGYFGPREGVWQEPIERNVWRLLTEFGDAEVASLIAPRPLIIEAATLPTQTFPLPVRQGRRGGAAPGSIASPTPPQVLVEVKRLQPIYDQLGVSSRLQTVAAAEDQRPLAEEPAGSHAACAALHLALGQQPDSLPLSKRLTLTQPGDTVERQRRQVQELIEFTQDLLRQSQPIRDRRWQSVDRSSPEKWAASGDQLRNMAWNELIGRLPTPTLPPAPRTRKVVEGPGYVGYEVLLFDVYPDVVAGGLLMLPTDIPAGEKRPVVVCQHGLEGTPTETIAGPDEPGYAVHQSFALTLCQRGFITYAPQNPCRGGDRFRTLQRKSHPLGLSLYSYILPQQQVTLNWLAGLPQVDPQRIAFYGVGAGGEAAIRVPALLPEYAVSICSAGFSDAISQHVSTEVPFSSVFQQDYETFEWNHGHIANHGEIAMLMAPRPFFVERGHDDPTSKDEWVAAEYAKVRRHYAKLGASGETDIEFFNGPHTIHGNQSFHFLHEHLNWPEPATLRNP